MFDASVWLTQFLLLALCLLCTVMIYFVVRVRYKAHSEGAFNVAYREETDASWVAGVCHYSEASLKWYRIMSMRWGSSLRWPRKTFEILDSKTETVDNVTVSVLYCQSEEQRFYLAMSPHDYSGLVAWHESSPPQAVQAY